MKLFRLNVHSIRCTECSLYKSINAKTHTCSHLAYDRPSIKNFPSKPCLNSKFSIYCRLSENKMNLGLLQCKRTHNHSWEIIYLKSDESKSCPQSLVIYICTAPTANISRTLTKIYKNLT